MKKYIMSMDQGTTSSRCIIFDHEGKICSIAQKEFRQIYPNAGWVEHNPLEIWSTQMSVAVEALAKLGISAKEIDSIGITNQRETTIVWDRFTGEPVYNAIVWQCRRTAALTDRLKKLPFAVDIQKKTGLIPDAYFSASKIAWILDNVPGARKRAEDGNLIFGTVDTWIIYQLTNKKVHATDYTNASRTMLYDIHNLRWDKEILDYFKIPESMLPDVLPSSHIYGRTDSSVFGSEVMIAGVAGDQQAALFGQCCFGEGDIKNTYGTGCFLLMNTGYNPFMSRNGLLTTIAAGNGEKIKYALEGSVFVGGAAVQWLRDGLRIIKNASSTVNYAKMVKDTNGMYIVPAFAGLGAPYWNPYARGTIVGITRGCEKEHYIRAVLESIAYQVYDVIASMKEDTGMNINSIKADGGACANDFLMQFQADITGQTVNRPECIETTALGAAFLAGLATGFYKDENELKDIWKLDKCFMPAMDADTKHNLLNGWKKAVKCALCWAEDNMDG